MPVSDLSEKIFSPLLSGSSIEPSPEFFAIPADAPRWLIATEGGKVDSVLANWSPYRPSSRLKWGAIRLANRMRVLPALPKVKRVRWNEVREIDWRALGWNRSADPVPLVYLGTPGPRRKAVIHLVDPVSRICQIVVKVPLCAGARQAILREAEALDA